MYRFADKLFNFLNSEKVHTRTYQICSVIIIGAITVSFFNIAEAGSAEDISLQLQVNPLTSVDTTTTETVSTTYHYSAGIKQVCYSDRNDSEKALSANTFLITEQASDEGVPVELIDKSEFTPDGASYWLRCNRCNLRAEPDVESEAIGSLSYAQKVTRLSYGSSWSLVRLSDGTEGYCLSSFLSDSEIIAPTATPTPTPIPTPVPQTEPVTQTQAEPETNDVPDTPVDNEPALADFTETPYSAVLYASCEMNLRTGPGTEYSMVRVLSAGDEIDVVAETSNGWYRTVKGNYVKASLCTSEKPAEPEPQNEGGGGGGGSSGGGGTDITGSNPLADYALQYVGCPYVYAGSSPSGFDCSGFVSYVYANYYGYSLPHSADGISDYGYAVSIDEIQPGDVFCNDHNGDGYMDHVSLYIGDGMVVHASTSTTGVIVSYVSNLRDVATIRRIV